MGQYYVPLIKRGKKYTAYSINGGLKLMEHSWIGNMNVDGIAELLYKKPARLAWVGDYAYDTEEERKIYIHAYGENDKTAEVNSIPIPTISIIDKILVNHTKKEYINMMLYIEGDDIIENVHPLPLLTALGNGRGGGDYRGENVDLVGRWSMDLISVEDTIPDGYNELCIHFMENY